MVNKKKIMHIIGAFAIFILALSGFFLTGENLISLIKMDEKITFSGPVYIIFFSFPFLSYLIVSVIFLNIKNRCPKYHDNFINCFGMIAIISFFLSFPLSFYVDYKLKSENYLVCKRISWTSPNTYVKDIKLCN
ncbi:membrane protein [Photorhabdus luminescens subsp. luminescens]|uniref:DUF1240 domain-containing protein n=1 Tax=Photorhabdus luminescens TaxID=29488 RepID=A0A1G5R529_PHOLU|nr:DUF1240 domain-containing protein [Photorhabdus luminescens]KMW73370.1 membrane protein [Photorhabdus luminescens subsp. luminescens]SCZ69193.1 Protein of unknown function [Photorhabdus luminescens]